MRSLIFTRWFAMVFKKKINTICHKGYQRAEQNDKISEYFLVKSTDPMQLKTFCCLFLTFRDCTHLIIKADLLC